MPVKPDLLPVQRQQQLLLQLASKEVARVSELASSLGVHEITIRRDLDELAASGRVERVHGGARLAGRTREEISYGVRAAAEVEAKVVIAAVACGLIEPGETIGLDASTTALALARRLVAAGLDLRNVVTTGLDAATSLAESDLPFTLVGGSFHSPARSFVGPLANSSLDRLHCSKVFFSAKGYSPAAGFTDAYPPEVECKEHLIASGGKVIALLDHSKFTVEALVTIVREDQVDLLITDLEPQAQIRAALERAGVEILVAGTP